MKNETRSVAMVVCDSEQCRLGTSLDVDLALTFIAVASEDPHVWNDILGYWPRYRTPVVSECIDRLPIATVDRDVAMRTIGDSNAWVAIDLEHKRIVTGRDFMAVGRDAAFNMYVSDHDQEQFPLSVHLPPWWEFHEQVDASVIGEPRHSPLHIPRVNRDVLYGDAMIEDLATRMLRTVHGERWRNSDAAQNERARYPLTVEVHRDWLMTPRDDLDGQMPRQLLHGAHEWMGRLAWAQQMRFHDGGTLVAAPVDVAGYETAPMGNDEVIMYFELCRALIEAGWSWCRDHPTSTTSGDATEDSRLELIQFLRNVKQDWLARPFEDDAPAGYVIECSRRRVPRGDGIPIVGMPAPPPVQHVADCDCPICEMMADGMFGPGFMFLDGHQLEWDGEFAFSMHATHEAWEQEQREFAETYDRLDSSPTDHLAESDCEADEFASAWSGTMSDGPLPGDSQGHLKLAFLLAEVISVLEFAGRTRSEIKRLNATFTKFRTCEPSQRVEPGRQLCEQLEALAAQHPELVSRAADFQSRIEEQIRAAAWNIEPDAP